MIEQTDRQTDRQMDRGLRDLTIVIANKHYSSVEDEFMPATRKQAKEIFDMELTEEEELMLGAAYKIGFADAMYLFFDGDDRDESAIEEGSR